MIDKSKTYTTNDGRPVVIYRTDGCGIFPVHGAFLIDGGWCMGTWRADGASSAYSTFNNLIEVKQKRRLDVWVNVYDDAPSSVVFGGWYRDKSEADAAGERAGGRFACIRIAREITEGDGQ